MLISIKRVSILCSALVTTALVATPYRIAFDNRSVHLEAQLALAKDGGKGGGGGANNGNGGGNSGNGGGNSGNAGGNRGNAGGKGVNNGNGGPNAGGNNGNSGNGGIDGSTMEVRHWNGMSERIKDGRYVMKDAKGRTIVNRTATTSDESRLRSFVH